MPENQIPTQLSYDQLVQRVMALEQENDRLKELAGGVAHNLNNLLHPILGFSERLLARSSTDKFQNNGLKQIVKAALGASNLVLQLLAFSRKQTLEHRNLDLNKVLMDNEKRLGRTISENIRLNIVTSPFIRPVMADIDQIEQVIMNLSINVADAMPEGGELTIETEPAELDDAYACEHPDVKPGAYVMMAFSYTGHVIDEEAFSKIVCEPFFSTIERNKGAGLGFSSTVYCIVKHLGGNIRVYSEPGNGTILKIYLPVSAKKNVEDQRPAPPVAHKTILLVEDSILREITKEILEFYGYTVLSAVNGKEALELPDAVLVRVDLLLTDVIMPDMNGRELYLNLSSKFPDLKVLFMSEHTNDDIARYGVLEKGLLCIQKPLIAKALSDKVCEVLNSC